jgi:hypothetical protein
MEEKTPYGVRPLPRPREGQAIQPGDFPKIEKHSDEIKFTAAVWKVSTLADGGIRLVLDLEEGARDIMGELARCQQNGILLEIKAEKES